MNETQTLYRLTWTNIDGSKGQYITPHWYQIREEYRVSRKQYSGRVNLDVQVGVLTWSDIDRSLDVSV